MIQVTTTEAQQRLPALAEAEGGNSVEIYADYGRTYPCCTVAVAVPVREAVCVFAAHPFGRQPPPECLKTRQGQNDVESQDRQTVLLGSHEYGRIITDDSPVCAAASQPLHRLPDWVRTSIRTEAVNRCVHIGRNARMANK